MSAMSEYARFTVGTSTVIDTPEVAQDSATTAPPHPAHKHVDGYLIQLVIEGKVLFASADPYPLYTDVSHVLKMLPKKDFEVRETGTDPLSVDVISPDGRTVSFVAGPDLTEERAGDAVELLRAAVIRQKVLNRSGR
jgi:hypothetical protein